MTTPAMVAAQQSLTPGARVELYILDLSPIGPNTQYYFSPSSYPDGRQIAFGGHTYTQVAVGFTGLERTADGSTPNPKITLPNYNKFAAGLVAQYGDLVGATVTKIVTYEQFLDQQPLADPNAMQSYDVFTVEQKSLLTNEVGEFLLRVPGDSANRYLPGRLVFKTICSWRYRTWNGSAFVYSTIRPCPYTGTSYFDINGTATTAANDVCSHDVPNGCVKRYPVPAVIPFGGFPGVNRTTAQQQGSN